MPNHYNLLIYLKTNRFSNLMQAFTLSYAKAINKRYQRVGSLFQGRFEAIHVGASQFCKKHFFIIVLSPLAYCTTRDRGQHYIYSLSQKDEV